MNNFCKKTLRKPNNFVYVGFGFSQPNLRYQRSLTKFASHTK
ncbi:hypothetical protein [Okeania sp. SIO2B3]|nr:hypothetical protein [Okeania sp. SIO2B3]